MMRAEMPGPTKEGITPRMQDTAWLFATIYCGLNLLLAGILYNVPPLRFKDIPYLYSTMESANNPIRFLVGWYVLAKLFELFDAQVLAHSHLVSGHSLKHVAAAVAGLVACRMLLRRTLAQPARAA